MMAGVWGIGKSQPSAPRFVAEQQVMPEKIWTSQESGDVSPNLRAVCAAMTTRVVHTQDLQCSSFLGSILQSLRRK